MKRILLSVIVLFVNNLQAQQGLWLQIRTENDFFNYRGKITDRYYTSGSRIGLTFSDRKKTGHLHSVSLNQKIYTPSDITNPAIRPDDHPYNGLLYVSYAQHRLAANGLRAISAELSFGSTGAGSYAGETQTGFHKLIRDKEPRGWDQVLELGALLQLRVDFRQALLQQKGLSVSVRKSFQAGTICNRLGFATEIKFGKDGFRFLREDLQYWPESKKQAGWYFFWVPAMEYAHRNRMLDVRPLLEKTDSRSVSVSLLVPEHIIFRSAAGISIYKRTFALTLAQHFSSREFKQGNHHAYGMISLAVKI